MTPDDLRTLRHAAGLTQAQLAALIDVAQPHVAKWEAGRYRISAPVAVLLRAVLIHGYREPAAHAASPSS